MTAHAHPHPHSHAAPAGGHDHDLASWRHSHVFDSGNRRGEARTRVVLLVTVLTMAVEIVAGWLTGSMALLADGWHMGTHAIALGVAAVAYALARKHAGDSRFTFGTWKIEVLGGFASAIVLGIVALGVLGESAVRLYEAKPIALQTALVVAVIGLVVNLVSAWLLHGADDGHGHGHGHDHGHAHGHGHAHHHDHAGHGHHDDHGHGGHDHHDHAAAKTATKGSDLNLRAAYVHVAADALTSLLAIAALLAALWLGWWWLDPLVGLLGAVVIAAWSIGLMRQSGTILLDRETDPTLAERMRAEIESDGDARVADLHVWRVGRDKFAAIASIVADQPLEPTVYRARLARHEALAHVSIEVNRCVAGEAAEFQGTHRTDRRGSQET